MKHRHPSRLVLIAAFTALSAAVATTTGCAVARDQQTVGAYIDDATITTKVKARMADSPVVSATSINVETLNGVVQLSGFAKTLEERTMAERIALGVSAVHSVRNDFVVRC